MADEDQVQTDEQTDEPEALTVTVASVEDVGTLKKKVNMEIPRDQINRKLDENYGELAKTAQVPGFRVGRAPRRLVEKRFGKDVREQVRLGLVSDGIERAIKQEDIKTIGEPDIDLDKITLPDEGDMTFSFEIEVEPEFDLPSLDTIAVTESPKEVTDKDIDEQIENIRWRWAELKDKPHDAKAEKGDHLSADVKLEVGDEPPSLRHDVDIAVRNHPIEGISFDQLEQTLTTAAVGETRETQATVSDEHTTEAWRGKTAKLTVTVKKISKWYPPELNEDLAQRIGFDTIDAWREVLKTELESRKGQQVRQDMEDQVRKYLLASTKFDLPEKMTDRQTERALLRRVMQLRQMGMPQVLIEEKLDELRTRAHDAAVEDLRLMFIVDKIARQREIEVSEGEANSVIAGMAANQGRRPERVRQEMARDGSLENVFSFVRERKVLEKLLENAKINKSTPEQADET